jgi:hypothetical protein
LSCDAAVGRMTRSRGQFDTRHDGDVTSWRRAAVRVLQTTSVATVLVGVTVLPQDTAPANAEFDPAALVSAFLLVAGFTGTVVFVAADGLVTLARGIW